MTFAKKELEKFDRRGEFAIDEANTIERPLIWVFSFQSKKYLETGEFRYKLAGNGPIIVNKKTGNVVQCGTAGGVEKWIKDFEMNLAAAQKLARS